MRIHSPLKKYLISKVFQAIRILNLNKNFNLNKKKTNQNQQKNIQQKKYQVFQKMIVIHK